MRSSYDRLELTLGAAGLVGAAVIAAGSPLVHTQELTNLLLLSAVLLLLQGFLRDLYLLRSGRWSRHSGGRRGWFLCMESTLGLFLLGQAALLSAIRADVSVQLPVSGWMLLLSLWWLFGYSIRDFVLELRRDPNHFNLLIGRPEPPHDTSMQPTTTAGPAA